MCICFYLYIDMLPCAFIHFLLLSCSALFSSLLFIFIHFSLLPSHTLSPPSLLHTIPVVAMLMEKDALRTSELEKMRRITALKREAQDVEVSAFDEMAPTSVLCIKCKRSLDDLANIRSAVYGAGVEGRKRQCEAYRSLLPNLRGRKPVQDTPWLKMCMRAILLSKMKEDVSLLQIKGEISRFPHFVYAWFERSAGAYSQ
jgi:hypothetical protein